VERQEELLKKIAGNSRSCGLSTEPLLHNSTIAPLWDFESERYDRMKRLQDMGSKKDQNIYKAPSLLPAEVNKNVTRKAAEVSLLRR